MWLGKSESQILKVKVIKCFLFSIKVGSGDIDHNVWERPEDLTARRPTMTLNASAPGSDVAGETAAALAAGAIAFRERGTKIQHLEFRLFKSSAVSTTHVCTVPTFNSCTS